MLYFHFFSGYRLSITFGLFSNVQVFDKNWHKVHISVFHEGVRLYVDCRELAYGTLQPRGNILTDGNITLARMQNEKSTAPVSWIRIFIELKSLLFLFLCSYLNCFIDRSSMDDNEL